MRPFKWNKGYNVFLPEVDAEHREIFRGAAELQHALETGADQAGVQAAMESLAAFIDEHFAHEERLMKAAACQSYEWHRRQHQTARKRTKALLAGFAAADAAAPGAYLEFLARWLKDHVGLTDRMMSAQVRNHSRVRGAAS
jgi:hemerythrin